MRIQDALQQVLDGSSLQQIAAEVRAEHLEKLGIDLAGADPRVGGDEVAAFMRTFARHLGDRHAGNPRIGQALRDWVRHSDHYEAWDALLSGFDVDGRDVLIRRGRVMFPGPMTAHWDDR